MGTRSRNRTLRRIVDVLEKHKDKLSDLQCLDNRMTSSLSHSDRVSGQAAADIFDYFPGWIDKLSGEVYPVYRDNPYFQFLSVKKPVGVVARILPIPKSRLSKSGEQKLQSNANQGAKRRRSAPMRG